MIVKRLSLSGALVLFIPALIVYFLSTSPDYTFNEENGAALIIGLKHITDKAHICDEDEVKSFLNKQSKKERTHLRKKASACGSRGRVPLKLKLWLDGSVLIDREYMPSGLYNDGNTFVFERFIIPTGEHRIKLKMRDSKNKNGSKFDYSFDKTLLFENRHVIVVDFDPLEKSFHISAGG